MLFNEVLTFGSVEEMLCSDHLKQPFVDLFFPCGLIVYYAVRADSEFFTCLSRKNHVNMRSTIVQNHKLS